MQVGDNVKVLSLPPIERGCYEQRDIAYIESMVGMQLEVYEVDEWASAWVQMEWTQGTQSEVHSLALELANMVRVGSGAIGTMSHPMDKRILILACATVVAVVCGAYLVKSHESEEPSAQTWVRGIGSGQAIALSQNGRYRYGAFCDICDRKDEVSGSWTSDGARIILKQIGKPLILERIEFKGCKGLVVLEEGGGNGDIALKDVYFLEHDACRANL